MDGLYALCDGVIAMVTLRGPSRQHDARPSQQDHQVGNKRNKEECEDWKSPGSSEKVHKDYKGSLHSRIQKYESKCIIWIGTVI